MWGKAEGIFPALAGQEGRSLSNSFLLQKMHASAEQFYVSS